MRARHLPQRARRRTRRSRALRADSPRRLRVPTRWASAGLPASRQRRRDELQHLPRCNGATPTLLTTTTTNATTFTDTTVSASTPYTYQVYAQDAAGKVGPAVQHRVGDHAREVATRRPRLRLRACRPKGLHQRDRPRLDGQHRCRYGRQRLQGVPEGPGRTRLHPARHYTGTGAGHNSYVDTTVKLRAAPTATT